MFIGIGVTLYEFSKIKLNMNILTLCNFDFFYTGGNKKMYSKFTLISRIDLN